MLTSSFLFAELVGAWLTKSLALLSDAAHMFTDTAALAIALAAIQIGRRPADKKRTFGYYRFEILAAAFNAVLLLLVGVYVLWEAWQRLRLPTEVQSVGMLAVETLGLLVNFASLRILQSSSDASLNVKGAYLEVWSDLLGSIGVIVAAAIIWATGWHWVDSVVGAGIGLWVIPRTWVLLRDSVNILLQGVPTGLDLAAVEAALLAFPGVKEIHALHVWAITSGRNVMSAHIIVEPQLLQDETLLSKINDELEHRYGLTHTTIQLESADAERPHD